MENEKQVSELDLTVVDELLLVSLRSRIDSELARREGDLATRLRRVKQARGKVRQDRKDKGTTKGPRKPAEKQESAS